MTRVKRGDVARKRRNRVLGLVAGAKQARSKLFRTANQQSMKALVSSHQNRICKKRDFHRLWITRTNAAARKEGLTYSQMRHRLKKARVLLDLKMLAQIAVLDKQAFSTILSTEEDLA